MTTMLHGHHILKNIYEDSRILVCFAKAEGRDDQKLLKIVKSGHRFKLETEKLVREYEAASRLDMAGIVRPERFIDRADKPMLELERIHGMTVRGYFRLNRSGTLEVTEFLRIAMWTTELLSRLHNQGFLHLNISPDTILLKPEAGCAYLTGLGCVTPIHPRDRSEPPLFSGKPNYMPPEQTGRTDHPVGVQSDLYSLGMTWYEMLTGTPPFAASGLLEWAHAHLAQAPVGLNHRNPAIPERLSAIVMKLLAKNPFDRYLSAERLQIDLLALWQGIERTKAGERSCIRIPLSEAECSNPGPEAKMLPGAELYSGEADVTRMLDLHAILHSGQTFSRYA